MRRYQEPDADNARWDGFAFRPGDVIVSAPSKSGTTWTQLLVALLVFDGPEFPAPLGELSPWMEAKFSPLEEVHRLLARQGHRRFIKSHTPLDGLPLHPEVRYVCVGRDPRDAAVSMLHHAANMDRQRVAELVGQTARTPEQRSVEEHIDRFIEGDQLPGWNLRSVAHHLHTFWQDRKAPNVELFHFADYLADLPGQLRRLAAHLGIPLSAQRARALAAEASIDTARHRAHEVAPAAKLGIWKDTSRFFRQGGRGEGPRAMTPAQHARYDGQLSDLPVAFVRWMHEGGSTASEDA
ncbi:MAG: sulfotransferase domain-containing protein [Myxococcales bacterium]|nr:sulfotransferase domain-containing protein [Myxococcales bacterium]